MSIEKQQRRRSRRRTPPLPFLFPSRIKEPTNMTLQDSIKPAHSIPSPPLEPTIPHQPRDTHIAPQNQESKNDTQSLASTDSEWNDKEIALQGMSSTIVDGPKEHEALQEGCGRERLKRHRIEVAGHVWIPDIWGQEELLKDWIDCSAFDAALVPNGIMLARAALVDEGRRANSGGLRIENRC